MSDALERLEREDARAAEVARLRLFAGLERQAEFGLDNLERACGRSLSADERGQLLAQQHQALRWTYLGSGMTHARFLDSLERLSPAARARIESVAQAFR